MNRNTIGFILQQIDDCAFHRTASETNAHLLWKKLESFFERKTTLTNVFIKTP